jgi:hypothetical protein
VTKAQTYLDYLTQEGFRPEVDEDGDISFKFEGRNYYLIVNEKDEMYFQLLRNGFWRIESAEELQRALMHANDVTRETKVAKTYVNSEHTYVNGTVEMFFDEVDQFKPCFMRALTVLQRAVRDFCDKMQESNEG